jgi:hypothetical protein
MMEEADKKMGGGTWTGKLFLLLTFLLKCCDIVANTITQEIKATGKATTDYTAMKMGEL